MYFFHWSGVLIIIEFALLKSLLFNEFNQVFSVFACNTFQTNIDVWLACLGSQVLGTNDIYIVLRAFGPWHF